MKISPIIEKLRDKLPPIQGKPWANRVGGAAEFEAVQDKQRLLLPSLFVMLGQDEARIKGDTFEQDLVERVIIIAALENTDRRGQGAQDQIHDLRKALFGCLLNWVIDPCAHSLEYIGSRMLAMDRARYFHRFEFQQRSLITEQDGVELELDDFNSLFVDWNLAESDLTNHPDAQDILQGLYNE